jgi:hypothetical protein
VMFALVKQFAAGYTAITGRATGAPRAPDTD